MTKYTLTFIFCLLVLSKLSAQSKTLIITDSATKTPLSGASARILHAGSIYKADKQGKIIIPSISKNDTILISYIGYTPDYLPADSLIDETTIIGLKQIKRDLQDIAVSTGYQTIPKERATGSFFNINNSELNQRVSSNLLDRMENLASGVLYDKRATDEPYKIQIRGLSTLTDAIAQPLIVVNNFPFTGDINSINPDDVKDITILKDAAAASIWGAKAGNGVIVITLKKPSSSNKPHIAFNSTMTFTARPDLIKADQMSSSDYINVEDTLFENGFYSWEFDNPSYPPITPVMDILYRQQQGLLSPAQAQKSIDSLRNFDIRKDMEKYLYRGSFEQQYNLSMSGGSNYFKYLFSVGYDKDLQNLDGNKSGRISFHWNNDWNVTKGLTINTDVLYTQNNTTANSPGGYGAFGLTTGTALYPYARLVNPDGSPAALDVYWNKYFTDTAGGGRLLDWKYRPLDELHNNDNTTVARQLIATLGINYAFDKYLSLDIKSQYGISATINNDNRNVNSFYTRNLINTFTNLSSSQPQVEYPVPIGGILIYGNNTQETYDFRGQINYNRQWGDRHAISAIAGAEIRQEMTGQKTYTTFGYNAGTLAFSDVDLANQYPTYDEISGDEYISDYNQMNGYLNRFVSYYGNASYTYLNKYAFSGSVRKDESNLFGVDANQKGVPLWSIGGAWKLSKENFYHVAWLPYLKLRLTYGRSGNVNNTVSSLATIQYLQASQSSIKIPYAGIANYPNPDLRWEKVNMFNAGIDFTIGNSVLYGSVEYYSKKSTDLLNTVDIDPTAGIQTMVINSASLTGKGVDITLNSTNIKGKFTWQTNLLFSYVNYKVLSTEHATSLVNFTSNGDQIFPVPGYNPYLIVSYKWGGLDEQGNPQGYVNGELSTDYSAIRTDSINQQVINGSALPTYFGNLRNTFSFKGFSLAVNISYRLGYYMRKPSLNYYNLFYYGKGDKEFADRWQKPGDENRTNVPAMIYPANQYRDLFYSNSSINVINADNIKLTDIYLGYNLKSIIHKTVFSSVEVFGVINNLNLMLWKANNAGIDPDFPTGLKVPKAIAFGLKCNL